MANIYRTLLREIEADDFQVLHQRTSLTPLRKLWIAMKHELGGALSWRPGAALAVIGAGWAGLAGAVEATRGRPFAVTLFEMAPQPGGRAREASTSDGRGRSTTASTS